MANLPQTIIQPHGGEKLEILHVPDYRTMQAIEYHWLTGKVTRIVYRKAEEIVELMDDAEARTGQVVQDG